MQLHLKVLIIRGLALSSRHVPTTRERPTFLCHPCVSVCHPQTGCTPFIYRYCDNVTTYFSKIYSIDVLVMQFLGSLKLESVPKAGTLNDSGVYNQITSLNLIRCYFHKRRNMSLLFLHHNSLW